MSMTAAKAIREMPVLMLIAGLIVLSGCASKKARTVTSPTKPVRVGHAETGLASWYGEPYHGRRAANGEVYDMYQMTAAHRTMPFETIVDVENLRNRKRVQVRITDRGPFVDDRVIDLSLAAARELDMVGAGVDKVRLKVVKLHGTSAKPIANHPGPPVGEDSKRCIQVGAFSTEERAVAASERVKQFGTVTTVATASGLRRAIVCGFTNASEASIALVRIRQDFPDAFVIAQR